MFYRSDVISWRFMNVEDQIQNQEDKLNHIQIKSTRQQRNQNPRSLFNFIWKKNMQNATYQRNAKKKNWDHRNKSNSNAGKIYAETNNNVIFLIRSRRNWKIPDEPKYWFENFEIIRFEEIYNHNSPKPKKTESRSWIVIKKKKKLTESSQRSVDHKSRFS